MTLINNPGRADVLMGDEWMASFASLETASAFAEMVATVNGLCVRTI
jgi:hypothetical protein